MVAPLIDVFLMPSHALIDELLMPSHPLIDEFLMPSHAFPHLAELGPYLDDGTL